jgi:trehalose-6-phosphatase
MTTKEKATEVKPRLFLDIDGVLNDHRPHPNGYCGIQWRCVEQLNRVIDATDCDLIIHSAWRYLVLNHSMTLDGFAAMLATHGVNVYRGINGRLEHRITRVTRFDRHQGSEDDRSEQIKEEAPLKYWAAVDDLQLDLPRRRFLKTDGRTGLTALGARTLIWMLQR